MESKQSFSTSEVAKYCHVTPDTIRKWAEAGRISVFKTPGGHRRIRRNDLLRFLRENSIPLHSELSDDGIRVLVVDDEKSIISVIRRFLDHAKIAFEVHVASDGFGIHHVSFNLSFRYHDKEVEAGERKLSTDGFLKRYAPLDDAGANGANGAAKPGPNGRTEPTLKPPTGSPEG